MVTTAERLPASTAAMARSPISSMRIIAEEFGAERVHRGFNGQGVTMLTSVLLEMGTEEQKRLVEPTI